MIIHNRWENKKMFQTTNQIWSNPLPLPNFPISPNQSTLFPVKSPLFLVKSPFVLRNPHFSQWNHHVSHRFSRFSHFFSTGKKPHETVPRLAVVQHLEELLDIADVQVHGSQPDLHLVVVQDALELLWVELEMMERTMEIEWCDVEIDLYFYVLKYNMIKWYWWDMFYELTFKMLLNSRHSDGSYIN